MTTLTINSVTVMQATGTLTTNNTNVSDLDTVTIGGTVYTFKASLTGTDGEVKVGGSADASLLNLAQAVNYTGTGYTPGDAQSQYVASAAHPTVRFSEFVLSNAVIATAVMAGTLGNATATTTTASTLSWGASTLTGGSDTVIISGTLSNATYSVESMKRVTVLDAPATNLQWMRAVRVSDEAVFCMRNGVLGCAITIPSVSKIGYAIQPLLTWKPTISTQPTAKTITTAQADQAVFTVVAASEATLSYQWQYNNGTTWANASGTVNGTAYTNDTTATLRADASTTGQHSLGHRCMVSNAAGVTFTVTVALSIT